MSASRHRYRSRRDKNKRAAKNARMIIICLAICIVVYLIMNRVWIYDYIVTSFY